MASISAETAGRGSDPDGQLRPDGPERVARADDHDPVVGADDRGRIGRGIEAGGGRSRWGLDDPEQAEQAEDHQGHHHDGAEPRTGRGIDTGHQPKGRSAGLRRPDTTEVPIGDRARPPRRAPTGRIGVPTAYEPEIGSNGGTVAGNGELVVGLVTKQCDHDDQSPRGV